MVAAILVFGAAACANPDYDPDATERDLVEAGLTDRQASCVVRGMNEEFGERRLQAHDLARESEHDRFLADVLDGCGVDVTSDAAPSS